MSYPNENSPLCGIVMLSNDYAVAWLRLSLCARNSKANLIATTRHFCSTIISKFGSALSVLKSSNFETLLPHYAENAKEDTEGWFSGGGCNRENTRSTQGVQLAYRCPSLTMLSMICQYPPLTNVPEVNDSIKLLEISCLCKTEQSTTNR
eukprot:2812013-Amphidinium_carterae.1